MIFIPVFLTTIVAAVSNTGLPALEAGAPMVITLDDTVKVPMALGIQVDELKVAELVEQSRGMV